MARYPGAQWRPLGTQIEPRLEKKNVIVLHTMVGSLTGTDAYFRREGYGGVESHFGVGGTGLVYQWQDTDWQADAQLEGNDNAISVETADLGPEFPSWSGSNVPAWTPAQVDAIVKLCVWLCETHGIPPVLAPDSAESRRGIGWHRLGIEPWREPGTELWSNSYAKVCPGDRRINQIRTVIVPRVAAALGGDDVKLTDKVDMYNETTKERYWAGQIMGMDEISVNSALQYAAASLWYARRTVVPALEKIRADQAAAKVREEALLAAVQGLDTAAVLARIDEVAAAEEQRARAEAERDAQLLALVREHAEGRLDAEAVVARIGELLTAAAPTEE